jgi:hypothetical protein
MSSTTLLTAEVAELRQVVRDLVDAARDMLEAPAGRSAADALIRLERVCARGDRIVGRAP